MKITRDMVISKSRGHNIDIISQSKIIPILDSSKIAKNGQDTGSSVVKVTREMIKR